MSLILTWAIIISFIILFYVLLDGFDLGIGILFPMLKHGNERDIAMSTVAPVWDGNETWLVFGAAALYGAFPLAYSVLLPALYIPIMIMLAALIFRGVAFEFRFKAPQKQRLWDRCFSLGSTIAAFMQGVILGTFIIGYGDSLPIDLERHYWLTPFSLMTGIAVVFGYALLGANWLIIKTSAELQNKMFVFSKYLLFCVALFLVAASLWTPLLDPRIATRWFSLPNFIYLLPLPLFTGIAVLANFYCLHNRHEIMPFVLSILLFTFSYVGFCISSWPYIIPHAVPVWEAASAPSSLEFLLFGALFLLPILIAYTIYAYRVFRGKVTKAIEY